MRLLANLRGWCRSRESIREISRLSQREMEDIGLSSACITAVTTHKGL